MCSNVKELSFDVPWGTMAVKAIGDPCSPPALLIHGLLDNAGSFDRIIPYLPKHFYYACVDLPGHGKSSWLPQGIRLGFMEYVLAIDRVVKQLKWKRFIVIGHSFGGVLAQYYSAVFPEEVIKLIVLDGHGPIGISMRTYLAHSRETHENNLRLEKKLMKSVPPSYSEDEALERIMVGRRNPITKEAAIPIFQRSVKKTGKGVQFTMDPRLRMLVYLPLSHQQHEINYQHIACPFLLILTKEMYDFLGLEYPELEEKSHVHIFKRNPEFRLAVIDGCHDMHGVNPDVIGPIIYEFMINKRCVL